MRVGLAKPASLCSTPAYVDSNYPDKGFLGRLRPVPSAEKRNVSCDLAVIGYIPYKRKVSGAYAMYTGKQGFGITSLFRSGNDDPPKRLTGIPELREFVSRKDFRVVLAITELTAYVVDGSVTQAGFDLHIAMGYTPVRPDMLVPWLPKLPATYLLGEPANPGGIGPRLIPSEDNDILFRVSVPLKVGRKTDTMQSWLMGKKAPSAGVTLACKITDAGECTAWVASTCFPSIAFYVNWGAQRFCHDVDINTKAEVDEFLDVEECTVAQQDFRCSEPGGVAPPAIMILN